jgi:transcriptional regulator with XRE-family HTH domain
MPTMVSDKDARLNIKANLNRMLATRGITRTKLARITGDPLMTISVTVAGKSTPNAALLARIAEALETSVEVLISPPKNNLSEAS